MKRGDSGALPYRTDCVEGVQCPDLAARRSSTEGVVETVSATNCAPQPSPQGRERVVVTYGGLAQGASGSSLRSHDTAFFQADLGNDTGEGRETPPCAARARRRRDSWAGLPSPPQERMEFRAPPLALCADSAPCVRRDSDVVELDGSVSGRSLGEALDHQLSGIQDLDLLLAGLQIDGAPHDVFMNHNLRVSAPVPSRCGIDAILWSVGE